MGTDRVKTTHGLPMSHTMHIYKMIKPVACEITLGESDTIIGDRLLQVEMKDLTIASILEVLQPQKIIEQYCIRSWHPLCGQSWRNLLYHQISGVSELQPRTRKWHL